MISCKGHIVTKRQFGKYSILWVGHVIYVTSHGEFNDFFIGHITLLLYEIEPSKKNLVISGD